MAGFISSPFRGIYKVTKHGIITLSETLYHELAQREANIKVSVLCPGYVGDTRFVDCERNRPSELHNAPSKEKSLEYEAPVEPVRPVLQGAMSPQQIADFVFSALGEDRFYIFPNPGFFRRMTQIRMEDIAQERNPTAFNAEAWGT